MSNEVKVYVQGDKLSIEERAGKLPDLPPIPAPTAISFTGTLGSVFDFLKFRAPIIDKQLAVVTIDRRKFSITAQANPNNPLADTVTGSIEVNPDLTKFKINQVGSNFSKETLVGFLRTMRQYFPDKEAHQQLQSTVKNLQVKVNISAGKNEDNRGNRSSNFDKTVDVENIPVSTIIQIPVFVGEADIRLALDICYDTSEQNVFFWFESAELNEIMYHGSNDRIDQEVKKIQSLGYLVLER